MTTPSGRLSNEPGRGEREREKMLIYSGHLRLCQQPRAAHAIRSDQNHLPICKSPGDNVPTFLRKMEVWSQVCIHGGKDPYHRQHKFSNENKILFTLYIILTSVLQHLES